MLLQHRVFYRDLLYSVSNTRIRRDRSRKLLPYYYAQFTSSSKRREETPHGGTSYTSYDYQAPRDIHMSYEEAQIRFYSYLFLFPFVFFAIYDLCFIERNSFSGKREIHFFGGLGHKHIGKYISKRIDQKYRECFYRMDTEETERVNNILGIILSKNELSDVLNNSPKVQVLLHSKPGIFLNLDGDIMYITSTLVDMCSTDSELAYIISHELAHYLLSHQAHRLLMYNIPAALTWGNTLSRGSIGAKMNARRFKGGRFLCYYPGYMGVDRFREKDADLLAITMATIAGYILHSVLYIIYI